MIATVGYAGLVFAASSALGIVIVLGFGSIIFLSALFITMALTLRSRWSGTSGQTRRRRER